MSFVGVPKGSHNQTVHPSGDYLYNSNSQLYTTALNAGIEVYDIHDFAKPRLVAMLPLPPVPGSRQRVARHHLQPDGHAGPTPRRCRTPPIIDTTIVDRPEIISVIVDPAINVHHQSTRRR